MERANSYAMIFHSVEKRLMELERRVAVLERHASIRDPVAICRDCEDRATKNDEVWGERRYWCDACYEIHLQGVSP